MVPAAIEGGSVGLFLVRTGGEGVGVEPLVTTLGDPQAALLLADAPADLVAEGSDAAPLGLRAGGRHAVLGRGGGGRTRPCA